MALEIYDKFAPRATAPSAEFVGGSIKGESVSGANDGTLLKAILINDYVGFTDALLAEAKMTLTGDVDTALSSQRLDAIKYIIDARSSARSLGLSDDAVLVGEAGMATVASNTHLLNVTNKLTYLLPSSVGAGETVVSVTGNTLVTSGGTYKLQSTGAVNKVASSVLVNDASAVLAGGVVTITSGQFMFTDGVGANGFNVNTETFTGTIDFTGVGSGTYWVGRVAGGGWVFKTSKPSFDLTTGLFVGETQPLSFLKNAVVLLSSVPQSFDTSETLAENNINLTTTQIVENYLKANQNLKVPSGTETLPSSTPTNYLAGAEIAYNLYAETAVVGLAVDGTISGTSGTIYMSYEGDFSSLPYGGQMPDGSISQTGFDIDYNVREAGYTTVAVDLSLADEFEFFVLTPAAGRCARINNKESALACGEDGLTLDILSLSTYTSGTYSLPSGLNWDDFYRVDMMVGLSPTAVEATGQLTKAMLNSSWSTLNIVTDGGENAFITRVSDTSFSVGRAGSRAVLQAIGKLNTGVL